MITKLVDGATAALVGAIKVVVLLGILVGLVVWAQADPESWKAAMAKIAGLGVALVSWAADQLAGLLNQAG